MSNAWFRHGLRCLSLAAVAVALAATSAAAGPRPGAPRALKLFSGFLGRQNANRWDCGLDADGHVCVDPNGSTTVGGGFWPKGTPDQYVFGSGLQVSGIIGGTKTAQFSWPGDTTAAFFEDPSGTHENGQSLTGIWNSANATDLANWPRDAYVLDPSLYDPGVLNLKAASQMDTWVRYWDGSPSRNAGRPHPLGILVDERGLSWNFPSGNEDVVYFIYTFTNITAKDPAVYAGRSDQDSLVAWGSRFQAANEQAFGVQIPDTGYEIDNAFAAFAMDADVSDQAKQNFTTAFLPFNMGIAFKSNWFAPRFIYPSTIFSPPFAPTVGEVGVKYLKSPLVDPADPSKGEIGLVLYSGTVNGGAFGDAANAAQVYRYMNGDLRASLGDAACNYPRSATQKPGDVHVCYIPTTPDDIRFFQSSGPFTLKPGKTQTIVVAYIAAAPVDNAAIKNRADAFIFPVGGPFPAQPESLAVNHDTLRTVDRLFGATGLLGDLNANGRIDQTEVTTVDRSLLGKGLVAQAVFDNKFLLPFPPESPDFFLVPGDNQVTIVWRQSPSENIPDPYYAVASNPAKGKLYDQNYRALDVEGYRIYRGRTRGDLQVIAQFDKAGTEYVDFTAELQYGNCAPELGNNTVADGCPADLATGHHVDISSPFVQIPPGGRVKLSTGSILVIQADTAVTGGGSSNVCARASPNAAPCPALGNSGIPFAFVDNGVRNGFTYFYTVAAFDVNSVKSTGVNFSSLEGSQPPKTVVPRKGSGQEAGGGGSTALLSPRSKALNPAAALPTIDAATGIFSGPMPPTDGLSAGFAIDVGQLITNATVGMQIDSVTPGSTGVLDFGGGPPATYYITLQRAAPQPPIQIQVPVSVDCCDVTNSGTAYAPLVALANNPKTARFKFGDTASFALSAGATTTVPGAWRTANWGRASVFGLPANSDENGPRWWTGAPNENTPSPNSSLCSPARGSCSITDFSKTAGSMPGVTIFHIQSYSSIRSVTGRDLDIIDGSVARAADFRVYWGSAGAIDSVIDVTHDAPVPFSRAVRASWGILNDSSFVGVTQSATLDGNNALLTWTDLYCVDPYPGIGFQASSSAPACDSPTIASLMNHARLSPIAIASVRDTATHTLATTGNGFVFYLNGHWFLMQLASLPAAGTVWNARFYSGNVTGTTGSYAFVPAVRPPAVPGLRAQGSFTGATFDSTHVSDAVLAKVHTVPDPYYVTNAFEQTTTNKVLRFVNLPSECIIRIYSLSGILVQVLPFHDATGGAETQWNLRNRNNQVVASGVYFYHVETPDGKSKIGRFTLVNFAQ